MPKCRGQCTKKVQKALASPFFVRLTGPNEIFLRSYKTCTKSESSIRPNHSFPSGDQSISLESPSVRPFFSWRTETPPPPGIPSFLALEDADDADPPWAAEAEGSLCQDLDEKSLVLCRNYSPRRLARRSSISRKIGKSQHCTGRARIQSARCG
jgi:hypothetical protein